jgi:hypothetical protein
MKRHIFPSSISVALLLLLALPAAVQAQSLPPSITNYPTALEVDPGQSASFIVGVTGTVPLSYQWQWKGTNLTDTSRVSGSQSNTLTIANAQASDAGTYRVTITNAYGSTSASASLRVGPRPVITSQLQSQNVLVGADVSLSVAATSPTPLSYQWTKNWLAAKSATNSSLVLSNVQTSDAGAYWVEVSNAGDWVFSARSRLTVTVTNALVTPIALTGWNADVVFENAPHPFAQAFDGYSYAWFESGFNGYPDGLPTSRLISSAFNSNVLFQLQPYDANNVLSLPNQSASGRTGTLTLVVPQTFKSLSVAAACAYGLLEENYGTMVLNFLDGSKSTVLAYRASDWWNYNPGSDPAAITGLACVATNAPLSGETVVYTPGVESGLMMEETDFDLTALGLAVKPLASITFTASTNGSASQLVTGVFAVSGQAVPPFQFVTSNGSLRLAPDGLHLSLGGYSSPGPIVLWASTNLTSWVPIITNSPGPGQGEFIDPTATNFLWRFYRARAVGGP